MARKFNLPRAICHRREVWGAHAPRVLVAAPRRNELEPPFARCSLNAPIHGSRNEVRPALRLEVRLAGTTFRADGSARPLPDKALPGPRAPLPAWVFDLRRPTAGESDTTLSARSSSWFESLTMAIGAGRLPGGRMVPDPVTWIVGEAGWVAGIGAGVAAEVVEPFAGVSSGPSNGGA